MSTEDIPVEYVCTIVNIDTDEEKQIILTLYTLPNQILIDRFAKKYLEGEWALVDWQETQVPSDYSPLL
jgi:hypothetical protein